MTLARVDLFRNRVCRAILRHPASVVALLAFVTFMVTLWGGYVYDDHLAFTRDPRLRDLSTWGRYWTEAYHGGPDNLYRPLVSMSFALGWFLWGEAAWPHHLGNVLLHALCAALVTRLAWQVVQVDGRSFRSVKPDSEAAPRRATVALVAGALFAVHPLHVEPVAMLVGRFELACCAFTLGALLLACRALTWWRAAAILGCFVGAVLSKEQGLTVPVLVGLLIACRRLRDGQGLFMPRRGPAGLLAAGLCLGLAGYVVLKEQYLRLPFLWERAFLSPNVQPLLETPGIERPFVAVALLGRYIALAMFPRVLSIDYGGYVLPHRLDLADPYLWLGGGVLVGGVVGCVLASRRRRWDIVFLLLGAFVTWFIVSNIAILIGVHFAERLVYLPSAFTVILVSLTVRWVPRQVWWVVLILLVARSVIYAERWTDEDRFYEESFAERPAMRIGVLASQAAQRRGDLAEAARYAEQARELDPREFQPWMQGAIIAQERGRPREALWLLDNASDRMPGLSGELRTSIRKAIDAQEAGDSSQSSP